MASRGKAKAKIFTFDLDQTKTIAEPATFTHCFPRLVSLYQRLSVPFLYNLRDSIKVERD